MRILLAEDEKALSKALVKIFEKNNYSVDVVYDGEDALSYLEAGCYDAAVLDIMMPKMDGITVLKRIRAEGIQIPVLMLTARSEIEDRVLGLDSGANDYLPKPFDTRELLARIRSITRTRIESDTKLSFGNKEEPDDLWNLSGGPVGRSGCSDIYEMQKITAGKKIPISTGITVVGIIHYNCKCPASIGLAGHFD